MERTAVGMTLITGGIWFAERDKKDEKEERKKWENNMEARSIRIEENQQNKYREKKYSYYIIFYRSQHK